MASLRRINPASTKNDNTGFGVQATQLGERYINKDGSFNIRKTGYPLLKRLSLYSKILQLSWAQFVLLILGLYIVMNLLFSAGYIMIGEDQLTGFIANTTWGRIKEIFFFSTQTFTTVGYGRINPIANGADLLASLETMTGWLFFALVTGLFYGRFTQPKAYLAFSDNALIAPFREGWGLMFRVVPYKMNHYLTNATMIVNIAFLEKEGEKSVYKFYELNLERKHVDALSTNWTVVHPIDNESPLLNFTEEDMKSADVEIYVQVSGFDHIFSNTVMQRTSYIFDEIIWRAKFKQMYHMSPNGQSTVIELDKLSEYEKLPEPEA